ncbi:MAG: hypothetical protein L6R42_004563 [Xanthoria sp. 1 TBL-2021]|nr:MAG: hypothetical protein L6R42_004563 [Xanthoria sp. 1 TBL-2021]
MDIHDFANHFAYPEQSMSSTNTPSNLDMAYAPFFFDTAINNPTANQDNINTSLDPANPPVATSMAGQNTSSHQSRIRDPKIRDPKILELATSLQQGLVSHATDGRTQPAWEAFCQFTHALKARSHHQGLGYRVAKHLDSFTTDPNDKTTLAADQLMRQLSNAFIKVTEEKELAQEAVQKQKEEMDRLRHERDQYRTKAFSTDNLVAHLQQRTQELQQSLHKIGRLNEINQGLRASNTSLAQRCKETAPRILSNEEVIKRYDEKNSHLTSVPATSGMAQAEGSLNSSSPWLPSIMTLPEQTTQYRGRIQPNQILESFQPGLITPPTSTGSSPLTKIVTPHHQEPPLHQCRNGRIKHKETPTQALPSNMFEGMPRVPASLRNIDMNDAAHGGEGASMGHISQQDLTAKLRYALQGSSSPDTSCIPRSGFGSEDANPDQTSIPTIPGNTSGPNQASPSYNHNAQAQPHWAVHPPQHKQHPATKRWLQNTAGVQQQAGQKRGSEWLNDVAPASGVPLPSKKAKNAMTTDIAKKERAPKKTPVKKAASKKTEPKRKAPGKTKKDKELEESMWTPEMINLQRELLGQPKEPPPASEPPKAMETITIPEEVDSDDDDQALRDLLEEFRNMEEEGATAAGNT